MNPTHSGKILVVDDNQTNRFILKTILSKLGHECILAENAIQGLRVLDQSFDLVLTDAMMPEMDGFEFIQEIRARQDVSDIPIIMVTTLSEKNDRLRAVEAGANDFISKPVDMTEVQVRSASLLRQKAQQDRIKSFQQDLQHMVEKRTQELKQALRDLDNAHVEVLERLCAAAEHKDDDTAMHIRRMSAYTALIAEKLGMSAEEVQIIRVSSPMHDVGKIGIPDHILLKPAKLDATEWHIMKTHPDVGSQILANATSRYMQMGAIIARTHHEKWDGSGYPEGLTGEDIPIAGRICAVADVFDALTSQRPYKAPFSTEQALEIMRAGRGTHFDPRVLDAFLEIMDDVLQIKAHYQDASCLAREDRIH